MEHPWLKEYEITSNSTKLIIGTHPPMPYCGKLEFFYGNLSEFWRFLDKIFPNNKLYDNGYPLKTNIIKFLEKNSFSITDMVFKTRVERFSTDKDMGKIDFEDLNPFLKDSIENSSITTIYFTSFAGTNSAKSLFKKWYKKVYGKSSEIGKSHYNQIIINGRVIKVIDLYSPSPSARRGIPRSKEYTDWSLTVVEPSVDDFRIYWYKKHLTI